MIRTLEKALHDIKYSDNIKLKLLFFDEHKKDKTMAKSRDKNKNIDDTLLLIENDAILKQELKLISRESSTESSVNQSSCLRIDNDNNFVLKTKEKTNKVISNTNYLKTRSSNISLINEINKREKNHDIVHEMFDIKCTQKPNEEITNEEKEKIEDDANHKTLVNDLSNIQDLEIISKPSKSATITNDLKNDLQSLLILMALSTTCSGSDNSNHILQDHQSTHMDNNNYKKVIKNAHHPISKVVTFNADQEISNLLKVEALQITAHDNTNILRKYAHKWIEYVKRQKEKKSHCQRLANINKFLNKLEKRKRSVNVNNEPANKAKFQARDYSTYQHRYKIQKHIIALQKAKLEQQNRLIEELKYNKIVEASRQSLDNMKEDIKQTYYDIDKHLKPKIKCLTNELKISEIEENSLILHCLKVPQFLQRMEARAREREEKHAIIRERRKQMEEERIRLRQQAEIAKAEMDKEEKQQRIKELREKRKREKIENIRKKQHAERLRALIVMADLHYEKSLTAKYGIRPLKLLVKLKRDNTEKARAHYEFQLKKNVFLNWMWHTEDMWYERNYKAEDFYRKKLLRKSFTCFKENHNQYLIKLQVAKDYYDLYVTKIVFKEFQNGILMLKKEFDKKWNNAIIYHNSNLLFKTLTCWRTLPALNALKREQDARKLRWREKVLQVVPDYVPPEE